MNRDHGRFALCEPSPGRSGVISKFSTSFVSVIRDAPHRSWMADPRSTCPLRYTRSAGLCTPRGRGLERGYRPRWRSLSPGQAASTTRRRCPRPPAPPAAPAWPSAASAPTPSSWGWGCWGFRAWSGCEGAWGLGEFRLWLFGHQAGILPNPCSRVLHGLATVGLTPTSEVGRGFGISRSLRTRLLYLDVSHHQERPRCALTIAKTLVPAALPAPRAKLSATVLNNSTRLALSDSLIAFAYPALSSTSC